MYRIRTSSGEEQVFKTLEEFNAAVRNGSISADSEIFHSRADKWLDIKTHPHYRSALDPAHGAPKSDGAGTRKPLVSPSGIQPGLFTGAPPSLSKSGIRPAVNLPNPPQVGQSGARQAIGNGPVPPKVNSGTRPSAAPMKEPALHQSGTRAALQIPQAPPKAAQPLKPQPSHAPILKAAPSAIPGKQAPPAASRPPAPSPPPAPVMARPSGPQPAAKLPVPAPKPKPKADLEFLEVESQAKPKAKPLESGSRPAANDFLVMDTGLDSPIRNSSGHRTITGEEELRDALPGPDRDGGAKASLKHAPVSNWNPRDNASAVATMAEAVPAAAGRAEMVMSAPVLEPEAHHIPALKSNEGKKGLVIGAVGALVLLGVVAFVWKPWAPVGAKAATEGAPVETPAPAPVSVTKPPVEQQTVSVQPAPVQKPAPQPVVPPAQTKPAPQPAAQPKSDSTPAEEQIVAAVKPEFSTASIDLGAKVDVPTVTTSGSGVAPSELTRRYNQAAATAKQDLYAKLMAAGFIRIFSVSRLSSADGVSSAQSAWSAGGDAISAYRTRIQKIEQAYDDSVLAAQRSGKWPPEELKVWAGRTSYTEPQESTQLANLMLKQVADLLGLLADQQGKLEVKGGAFAFKDPDIAQQYNSRRIWIAQHMETWNSTPEAARPLSTTQILKALGDGFPAGQ
jgi:outer membrane biosynthesis protein TonB